MQEFREKLAPVIAAALDAERASGRLPDCDICHQPQLVPGFVDLTVGVPDAEGWYRGRKRHRCVTCPSPDEQVGQARREARASVLDELVASYEVAESEEIQRHVLGVVAEFRRRATEGVGRDGSA